MEKLNLFEAENTGRVDVSAALGASGTTMYLYDVRPGGSSSPYHYEFEEEWLLVLDGRVAVRTPDGEVTLERGDLVCFPAGPAGAHKVMNRTDAEARVLFFSRATAQGFSVYPDSDKIGVWTGPDDRGRFFKFGTAVSWAEGEDGWERAD